VKPGTLKNRCALQARTSGVDAVGQPVETWTEVTAFWANVRFTSGYESIKSEKTTETLRASIRARYPLAQSANVGMRIVSAGITYNIEAIQPDASDREHVDLVCEVVR